MRQRPVLMPGGWPREEIEKETCARALLASGGDLERVYDESDLGLDAYIHHIARVPFFRSAQEDAIVLATGTIQSVVDLLQFYTRLYELVDTFDRATWIAYLARNRLGEFLRQAQTWGDVEYLGGEMYCWYTSPSPILIISNQSHASGLRRAVNDLEQAPESGVVAVGNDASGVASASAPRGPVVTASSLSSGSIAQLRLESKALGVGRPGSGPEQRVPTPPGNPRIRRNTG